MNISEQQSKTLKEARIWVQSELDKVSNFWVKNGWDDEFGGVYTCLDNKGELYSTDKAVWMQGRCAWTYAYLCNNYGLREEWKAFSNSCLDFMEEHCINREAGNRMYFLTTKDGQPLRQRRYSFSEAFYVIANAEYYKLSGEEIYLERAKEAYELIYKLNHGLMADPCGYGAKTDPQTRPMRGLATPMIYLNISSVMRRCDPQGQSFYEKRASEAVNEIMQYHYKPELNCTLENVGLNGEYLAEITDGRMVNPGHDIECSWFLLEAAEYLNEESVADVAQDIYDMAMNKGWDTSYGGLLYFIDCENLPPQAYEHDMKLWWPHNEALIASLMLYKKTENAQYLADFEKVLSYCRETFADKEYGEWYGYCRRDGKVTEPAAKGSTFKGPFHVPRSLAIVDKLIGEILNAQITN